jgi:hypothetical protein
MSGPSATTATSKTSLPSKTRSWRPSLPPLSAAASVPETLKGHDAGASSPSGRPGSNRRSVPSSDGVPDDLQAAKVRARIRFHRAAEGCVVFRLRFHIGLHQTRATVP